MSSPSGTRSLLALLLALALAAAACGSDDGEDVRGEVSVLGDEGASASGSGSASAPAGDDRSPAVPSVGDGGYEYASNVDAHRLVVADICGIGDLLDAGDFAAVETIYRDGVNSVNSDGSVRSIGGFASRDGRNHGYDVYYGTPLDDFVTAALNGTGMFEGQSDAVRAQGVEKGIQNQAMVAWLKHELVAALNKAEEGNFDIAEGAVHNWDEGWAFYHGAEPGCSPWATANKRAGNFGTLGADDSTALANEAILAAMISGRDALVAGDTEVAGEAAAEVERNVAITYSQAAIRYAALIEGDLADGDAETAKVHQAEGFAFFRIIEPDAAATGADVDAILAILSLENEPGANGFGTEVQAALQPMFDQLGISAGDIGVLE